MTAAIPLLIVVLVFTLAVAAALVVVVVGIRGDERCQSLSQTPRTRTEAITRRVLGAYATPDHNVHRIRADLRR